MDTTLIHATPIGGHHVQLVWSDETEHDVDFAGLTDAPPLGLAVAAEGSALTWDHGQRIDAADLWRLALEQGAARLLAWRKRHAMTQPQAAGVLGIKERKLRYYETAAHPIPKMLWLALDGYDARLGLPVRPAPERPGTPGNS